MRLRTQIALVATGLAIVASVHLGAQAAGQTAAQGRGRGGAAPGPPAAPPTPRAIAPIDLTGYWVAIITEDWRWRMVTPPRGDYASIPINAKGKRIADLWDPAKDESAGEQC